MARMGTDGSLLHTNLDLCVSFQWCFSGSWKLSSFGSLGKAFFQWLIIPGYSFVRDLGILKPVTRTSLEHLVKFSGEVPAVSYQHQCGLPSWGGHCLEQPPWLDSLRLSPAVMLAGAGSKAVEGPLIICCPWPRWQLLYFYLPPRNCLWLQLPSLQLHQIPFSPEAWAALVDKAPFFPRHARPSFYYLTFWEMFYFLSRKKRSVRHGVDKTPSCSMYTSVWSPVS